MVVAEAISGTPPLEPPGCAARVEGPPNDALPLACVSGGARYAGLGFRKGVHPQ